MFYSSAWHQLTPLPCHLPAIESGTPAAFDESETKQQTHNNSVTNITKCVICKHFRYTLCVREHQNEWLSKPEVSNIRIVGLNWHSKSCNLADQMNWESVFWLKIILWMVLNWLFYPCRGQNETENSEPLPHRVTHVAMG